MRTSEQHCEVLCSKYFLLENGLSSVWSGPLPTPSKLPVPSTHQTVDMSMKEKTSWSTLPVDVAQNDKRTLLAGLGATTQGHQWASLGPLVIEHHNFSIRGLWRGLWNEWQDIHDTAVTSCYYQRLRSSSKMTSGTRMRQCHRVIDRGTQKSSSRFGVIVEFRPRPIVHLLCDWASDAPGFPFVPSV